MEFLRNLMTQMTTLQEEEERKVTTHKGNYGNSYQPDEDDEEKKPTSGEKRGRGRPRKDADASGHVPSHKMPKDAPAWLTGGKFKAPKSDAKNTKKHSLKDWFNHFDKKMIAEDEASEKAAHADKPAEKKKEKADDKPAEKKADSKPAAKKDDKPAEKKADSKPAAKAPEKKAAEKSPASNFKKPNNPNRTPMDSARALAQKGMAKQGGSAKEGGPAKPKTIDRNVTKTLLKLLRKAHSKEQTQEEAVTEDGMNTEYTTSPQKPGGVDIKDKQGDIVASAKSSQAADMFKKGDISLSAPDDIQEGNQGLTRQEKMKLKQYMKMMSGAQEFFQELEEKYEIGEYDEPGEPVGPFGEMAEAIASFDPGVGLSEADQPTQSNDMGAGLGAGRKPEVLEGQSKITIKGLSAWKAKAEACNLKVENVSDRMWRAINPKTGGLRGTFHKDGIPGPGSLWGSSRPGTSAGHGDLYLEEAKKKEDLKMDKKTPIKEEKVKNPNFMVVTRGNENHYTTLKDALDDSLTPTGKVYYKNRFLGTTGVLKAEKKYKKDTKTKVVESAEHRLQAAHHAGKAHALAKQSYSCGCDDVEEAHMYLEGYKEGLDDLYAHMPDVSINEPAAEIDPFASEPTRSPISGMSSPAGMPGPGSSPIGGMPPRNSFDEMAFESFDKQLNALLLDEGMTVSISKGQEGTPDSVSVNATDADSESLLAMVKSAGLGVFAADAEPEASTGAPSDYGTSPEVPATEPETHGDIPVGNHDSMLDLIKKATGGGDVEGIAAVEVDPAQQDAESHEAVDEMEAPAPAQSSAPAQTPAAQAVPDDIQEEEVDEAHSDTAFGADAEMRAGADNDDSSQHGSGTPQSSAPAQGDRDKPGKGDFDFTEEEEIDESLANSDDDGYEADIDFMTRVIGGGLNKEKATGQSTIPVVADQAPRLGNPMRESTDLLQDWRKLAGVK